MKSIKPTIAGALVVMLLLTACGGGDETSETSEPSETETSGEDQADGILRVAYAEEPDSFDPALATIGASHQVMEHVYATLTNLNTEAEVVPGLAKEWSLSEDGKTYTFELEEGITFHNGDPLEASDVVYTLERLVDPDIGYSYASQVDMIDSVTAVNETTVEVALSQPTAPFLTFLAFPGSSIVPESVVEEQGDLSGEPVGSGAFRFVEYQPGTKLVLERNPDYYGDPPNIETLEMHFMSDPTERANALLGGEVDFATRVAPRDYERIVAEDGFSGSDFLGGQWYWIMLNTEDEALQDPLVRRAISLAVNREEISEALFEGYAEPILGGPIPSWNWAHAPELEEIPPTGDPEASMQLLEEAGYPDGLDLTMTLGSAWPALVDQGPLIQSALERVGIDVTLESMENPRFMDQVWAEGQYEMSNMFWLSPLADPDDFMFLNYRCGSGMNPQRYCSEELDEMLSAARQETDQDTRADLYADAQAFVMEEMPLIPTVNANLLDAYGEYVEGFEPMRTGMYKTFERVSIDR